jgi:hypothetical protein
MLIGVILAAFIQTVVLIDVYADCCYAGCHYAECYGVSVSSQNMRW